MFVSDRLDRTRDRQGEIGNFLESYLVGCVLLVDNDFRDQSAVVYGAVESTEASWTFRTIKEESFDRLQPDKFNAAVVDNHALRLHFSRKEYTPVDVNTSPLSARRDAIEAEQQQQQQQQEGEEEALSEEEAEEEALARADARLFEDMDWDDDEIAEFLERACPGKDVC